MSNYADRTAQGTGQDSWQGDKADVRHAQEGSCDWAHHDMERDKGPSHLLECQVKEHTALKQCSQQASEGGKDAGVLLDRSSLKQQAASRSFLHSLQGRLLLVSFCWRFLQMKERSSSPFNSCGWEI